jgi:hypothetical protein
MGLLKKRKLQESDTEKLKRIWDAAYLRDRWAFFARFRANMIYQNGKPIVYYQYDQLTADNQVLLLNHFTNYQVYDHFKL